MFQHSIKIAFRHLQRHKLLSLINILGLSVGIGCFTLFMFFAVHEFNYDSFHRNKNSIYKIYRDEVKTADFTEGPNYSLPVPFGPAIKEDFPGIRRFMRIRGAGEKFVRADNKIQLVDRPIFTDSTLFTMFSFPMLHSNPSKVFEEPNSAVLTQNMAQKLFAEENPVGKIIEIKVENSYQPFKVTGVCKNIPSNSTIRFDIAIPFSYFAGTASGKTNINSWNRSSCHTYVQLQEGMTLPDARLMNKFSQKHFAERTQMEKQVTGKPEPTVNYAFIPLTDVHTTNSISGDRVINTSIIWILITISSGILLIACINFTTLAIGRSAGRAREVGIKKIVGGNRRGLMLQFLGESLLLSIASLALGLIITHLLLPQFNALSGEKIEFSLTEFPQLLWLLAILVIVTGLMSGFYPSFVLSSLKPVQVQKQKLKLGGANLFTRSLITFQFILSITFIIATVVVLQQLNLLKTENPGFKKENLLVIDTEGANPDHVHSLLMQKLQAIPQVKSVAASSSGLGANSGWDINFFDHHGKNTMAYYYMVDPLYFHTLGIEFLAGQDFDLDSKNDSLSVIVNESFIKKIGIPKSEAIGYVLTGYSHKACPVIKGLVRDYHFESLKNEIQPQLFFNGTSGSMIFVRLHPGHPSESISKMESAWSALATGQPLNYSFVDENLEAFYREEEHVALVAGWAGSICIFLACLGLFGLVALSTVNRTKEIGIRKVLGAGVLSITRLLSVEFMKLILLAFIIAIPLAWYGMHLWLRDYALRVEIRWWVIAAVGVGTMLLALLTISLRTIKAAGENPVKNLKTE